MEDKYKIENIKAVIISHQTALAIWNKGITKQEQVDEVIAAIESNEIPQEDGDFVSIILKQPIADSWLSFLKGEMLEDVPLHLSRPIADAFVIGLAIFYAPDNRFKLTVG